MCWISHLHLQVSVDSRTIEFSQMDGLGGPNTKKNIPDDESMDMPEGYDE